ncbi:hypothetical protein ALC60_02396 [Trachymyrmex zeteki]|uniref:Uncharacterized protein n=1 Tax=Mycetomoellerius zeteki TaxID=64791 RepID=A0A151XEP9_9HYME|nr:hypothetical protein ALC60_02396 [Trachymyrmex zeteki]
MEWLEGGSGDAPAKKSRENHESKPLIRVAAGSIGPTDADRWVSMETRICPLGPYVPTSSAAASIRCRRVFALHEKPPNERDNDARTPRGWRLAWSINGNRNKGCGRREQSATTRAVEHFYSPLVKQTFCLLITATRPRFTFLLILQFLMDNFVRSYILLIDIFI